MTGNDIFDELFVLEMANNHLGDVQRGLKIIGNYAQVVRFNKVRAAIKLQLRDVDTFIHKDFRRRGDIRYIKANIPSLTEVIYRRGLPPQAAKPAKAGGK
jgi:N-acetylneuraminate synthase